MAAAEPAVNRLVALKHCAVYVRNGSVRTVFADQTKYGAYPHPEDHHYHVIAHRCGYGDDIAAYCFEHEVAHCYVAQFVHDEPSHVLWCHAHGVEPDPTLALSEELLAQTLQRYARAGEEPIVAGVDWRRMRDGFLERLS